MQTHAHPPVCLADVLVFFQRPHGQRAKQLLRDLRRSAGWAVVWGQRRERSSMQGSAQGPRHGRGSTGLQLHAHATKHLTHAASAAAAGLRLFAEAAACCLLTEKRVSRRSK